MKRIIITSFLVTWTFLQTNAQDSTNVKQSWSKKTINKIVKLFDFFSEVDTTYIEPQHYNFSAMIQNTNTYETYFLKSKTGNSIRFAPEPTIKIGPYFGWRWIFLGYTFDIAHLNSKNKKELDLSLYTSAIGIDLFYRQTGNDYKIRSIQTILNNETKEFKAISFDGLSVGIKGFNIYYIFNHKKFSYPAAFSQSTVQKKSCGSPLIGFGVTKHTLELNYEKLQKVLADNIKNYSSIQDNDLKFSKVSYIDLSVSGGYAYNFVFAKNWLLSGSLSLAIGYKKATGDVITNKESKNDFSIKNFNLDGIGRFGLVWNNKQFYAGASAIIHTYNYSKPQFKTNNMFGNLNIYVGVNFGKKKQYKNK